MTAARKVHLQMAIRSRTACGLKPSAARGDSFNPLKVTCRMCRDIFSGLVAQNGPIILPAFQPKTTRETL